MTRLQTLYDIKQKYELQLKDTCMHESYEAVACIENALVSIERKIRDDKYDITWQQLLYSGDRK